MDKLKETKELVKFIISLVNQSSKALQDKEVTAKDAVLLFEPLRLAGAAIKDINLVLPELLGMDETMANELSEFIKSELDLPNDRVEEFVEDIISLSISFAVTLNQFRYLQTIDNSAGGGELG